MTKHLPFIICSSLEAFVILLIFHIVEYTNDQFVFKGIIFGTVTILYIATISFLKSEHIVYLVILLSFLDVPIKRLYTSSTNILILFAGMVLFFRYAVVEKDKGKDSMFSKLGRSSITFPLILLLGAYTVSFGFVKNAYGEHFIMYQSMICAAIMAWMIIAILREEKHLTAINTVMLLGLLMNLGFSFLFMLYPHIDTIRAKLLSLSAIPDEAESIIQGLSFRGEAYGEYLMLCALWLLAMLVRGQFAKGKFFTYMITAATFIALIMTKSRGPNAVFFIGAILILMTSPVQLWKKAAAFIGVLLFFASALFIQHTYSPEVTLLDRFSEFSDTSRNVGYIPQTRYYTWAPSVQLATSQHFLGGGPSFAPNVTETEWRKIVADKASGGLSTWPHNIVLLVLCTVGIYGLLIYMFLVFRTMRLRKVFRNLEPYLRDCYFAYFICFVMFLFEAQKFDGFLRRPTTNFYIIFILIAVIFSSENMVSEIAPSVTPGGVFRDPDSTKAQ